MERHSVLSEVDIGISVSIDAELERLRQHMAEGATIVETATSDMDRATRRAAQSFGRLEGRLDPSARALRTLDRDSRKVQDALNRKATTTDRAANVLRRLNDQYEQTVARLRQVDVASRRANASVARGSRRLSAATSQSRRFGLAAQNAAFQVGDFAVQVASGTSATRALTQQLPQLLGGFGVLGAVIGAAVAVGGALAPVLLDLGEKTEENNDALDRYNAALALANRQMDISERLSRELTAARRDEAETIATITAGLVAEDAVLKELNRERSFLQNAIVNQPPSRVLEDDKAAFEEIIVQIDETTARIDNLLARRNFLANPPNPVPPGRFGRDLGLPDVDSLRLTNDELEDYFRKAGRLPQSMEDIEKAARTAEGALDRAQDRIRQLGLEAQAASGAITSTDAAVMNMEAGLRAAGVSGEALTTTLADYRVALERAEAASAASASAIRQENDAAKEAARTVDDIASRATGALGDVFYDGLRGEHTDFLQFFEDTFLRTVADLAAEAAKNAIIVPIVTQAVQGAPDLFGVSRAGAASLDGGAGQAAGGFFSGLGRLFGGGASAAGASGAAGAAGAAAGAASIASIASVALPIAALAAPLALGLFRGRDDPDPRSEARGAVSGGGLSVLSSSAADGGDAGRSVAVLAAAQQGLAQVEEALGQTVGAFEINARVIEETGAITVEAAGQVGTFKEETEAALFAVQALAGGMHGLSPAMEAATRGADSVQEAVQQIERLQQFQRIGVTFNDIETQAGAIDETFAALTETASELGFAQERLADIERDRTRAIGLLRTELERDLALQLAQIENAAAAQIASIRGSQAEQLRAAAAVGLDLVEVERVFGAERLAVVQDFSEQQLRALLEAGPLVRALSEFETVRRGIAAEVDAVAEGFESTLDAYGRFRNGLQGFLDGLALDDRLSILDPREQLTEAEAIFERTLAAARDGDAAAIDRLQSVSRDFLDESLSFNAATTAFEEDFNRVTAALEGFGVDDAFAETADVAEEQLGILTQIRDLLAAADPNLILLSEQFRRAGLDPATLDPLRAARGGVSEAQAQENIAALERAYSEALIAGRAGDRGSAQAWRGITAALRNRGALPGGYRQDFEDLLERFPDLDPLGFSTGGIMRFDGAFGGADSQATLIRTMPSETVTVQRPGQDIINTDGVRNDMDRGFTALVDELRGLRREVASLRRENQETRRALEMERLQRAAIGS